jgi:uncharacterized membrane protein YqhA
VSDRDLTWYIIIHLVFVVSGVILALRVIRFSFV